MRDVCILIPAYNEARTIVEVVEKVKNFGYDVIVIDDGSADKTATLAEDAGAFVIRNDVNEGKGASIKKGISCILKKPCKAAIIMDGDGQHNPEEIHKFIEAAANSGSSFIIGNRMANPTSMPIIRFITNKVMSLVISAICRQAIPDTQCGYKLIEKSALQKLTLSSLRYDIESEMLFDAARAGIKIYSVPIKTIYRKEESHIRPFIDTLRFIRLLVNKVLRKKVG